MYGLYASLKTYVYIKLHFCRYIPQNTHWTYKTVLYLKTQGQI